MTKYKILLSKSSLKGLKSIDKSMQKKIKETVRELEDDPVTSRPKADIKKMYKLSKHQLYRLRVGNYRIVYTIENTNVKIAKIFHRGKGYKWLE